jgi:hypothetical protein
MPAKSLYRFGSAVILSIILSDEAFQPFFS